MKIIFLTVGDITWASSRYRSYWPAQYLPNAEAIQVRNGVQVPLDADVYIWMKTGDVGVMQQLRELGKKQFIEVCDPNWWNEPLLVRRMADEMSAFVAASVPAAVDFREWYGGDKPIFVIPDRLDLNHYRRRHPHMPVDPVRLIWYGLFANRISLFATLANLERLSANGVNIALTICDNYPTQEWIVTNKFPIYYVRWELEKESDIIGAHDIALLPPYPGPWGVLKTNNKQLTAWACGLPVTTGEDYAEIYDLCVSTQNRQDAADNGHDLLKAEYDVRQTAKQWLEVIERVRNDSA